MMKNMKNINRYSKHPFVSTTRNRPDSIRVFQDSAGDPFFETQENHHLIGVASLFLEAILHDVCLTYQVPIISQQGEVVGRLHVSHSVGIVIGTGVFVVC